VPLSAEQFEQQQENFEEGKYNMNILSLLNIISYCILILYAYKDFLATLYFIYIPWVAFGLIVLGAALSHIYGPFKLNLINGICNIILRVALCAVCLSGSRLLKICFC
jgi:hypothetical protein